MPKPAMLPLPKIGRPKGANFLTALHYLKRNYPVDAVMRLGIPRRTVYRARKYLELNNKKPGRRVP